MKKILLKLLGVILIFSCKNVENKKEGELLNHKIEDTLIKEQIDSIKRDDFWGYDTLLLKEYKSDDENIIQIRGNESGFIYRISTKSKKGIKKDFDVNSNIYMASHTSILWDNNDYLFIRYGCGSPCWGGKLLSLNNEENIKDYQYYLYEDSLNNLILYPDESWESLILENFSTKEIRKEKFDFCGESPNPFYVIDTVMNKSSKSVEVKYRTKDCEIKKNKLIEIK